MSTGNESADKQQMRVKEFLQLMPITFEIAGLPHAEIGKHFNEGQMEVRVNTLKNAYRMARLLVQEVAKG